MNSAAIAPRASFNLTEKGFLLGIMLFSSVLILMNLGGSYLWQDEAGTAVLARTILKHGVPKGTDGFNSYSMDQTGNNSDMTKNGTWIRTPWLPYYLLAPLIKFLPPEGTEAWLRLPFALFGIATVPLTHALARRFFGTRVAVTSAIFLPLCVPFLLYSRQCRYYALAMFFGTWLLLAYDKFLKGEKRARIHLFVSQLLLFHSNYAIWTGLVLGVALHFFIFSLSKPLLKRALWLALAALAIHFPWVLLFSKKAIQDIRDPTVYAFILKLFLTGFNNHLLPFVFIALCTLIVIGTQGKRISFSWENLRKSLPFNRLALMSVVIVSTIGVVALNPGYFFRYFTGIIPLGVIAKAFFAVKALELSRTLGLALTVLVLFTNILSLPEGAFTQPPARRLRQGFFQAQGNLAFLRFPFFDYLYEITHEYRGPIRGIVEYLREHAKDGQRVAVPYGDIPLKYYLPRLRILGGLSGDDLVAEKAETADWIILRHRLLSEVQPVQKYLLTHVDFAKYQAIRLNYPDFAFENVPEPEAHLYRTATGIEPVFIFKKIS